MTKRAFLLISLIIIAFSFSGCGSLQSAAKRGDNVAIQRLLDQGADINAKDNDGSTALIAAALRGKTETVRLLIEKSADLNARDNAGYTALTTAAIVGFTDIARSLINAGADVHTKNKRGQTALFVAAKYGYTDIVDALINASADVNTNDNEVFTALMIAAKEGHTKTAKLLINKNADVNTKNKWGQTALIYAALYDHTDIAKLLIEKGADINAKDDLGKTALFYAKKSGDTQIVRLLEPAKKSLAMTGDINAQLIRAAKDGDIDSVRSLIGAGADINARGAGGETALTEALFSFSLNTKNQKGKMEIAKLLVEKGAYLNIRDKSGKVPFVLLIKDICYFKMPEGIDAFDMINLFLDNGADINANGDDKINIGKTALIMAAEFAKSDIVKLLIDRGADLDVTENNGAMALMYAANRGNTNITKLLINKGANLDITDRNGMTILMHTTSGRKVNIVRLLIESGADVSVKDDRGNTALDIAESKGYTKLADIISGAAAKKARVKVAARVKESKKTTEALAVSNVSFGDYYALVIGNNDYAHFSKLNTAANDARAISALLKDDYGYDVKLITDATRSDILLALNDYRKRLTKSDNLLIYYAGHGWLDKDGDEGYWLPVDAERDNELNWVSNSSITTTLRAMQAKHVLVVADSCYSGKLSRGIKLRQKSPDHYARLAWKKARTALTSGGLEPVDDAGKDGHSVFAAEFIDALRENEKIIDCTELFTNIRRPIILNSDQTPEYSDIRKAGHDGGDFLFIRKK